MEKRYEVIDKIIAAETFLYIIFMFISKGEAIRNILLFSGFALWLATLRHRNNRDILKGPVPLLFWSFMATVLVSAIFSLEPLYSLRELVVDPLKAVILFCLISTTLSDHQRLKAFTYVSLLILLLTLSAGYYSYWAYKLPIMKPVLDIQHSWHARFAMDINTVLPFAFIIFLMTEDIRTRIIVMTTLILSIIAIILSTSRGGIAAFIIITFVWSIFFIRRYRVNFKMILAVLVVLTVIVGAIISQMPNIKKRYAGSSSDVATLNERTEIWKPLIAAAAERPVFGWGYGEDIFAMDKPFENTPSGEAPVHIKRAFRNPHNAFLKILFHQGLMGVMLYTALLVAATVTFWKKAKCSADLKGHVLCACAAIMTGIYFVNSLTENPHFTDLALILGIGLAAANLKNEDSHT